MDKEQIIKKIDRGHRFRELLENPTFRELIDDVGSNAFHAWNISAVDDQEAQKHAKYDLEAGKRLLAFCKSHITAGQLAQKQLAKEESRETKEDEERETRS